MSQRVRRSERKRRQAELEKEQLERDRGLYIEAGCTPETLPSWLKERLKEAGL